MDMRALPTIALLLALTACGNGTGDTHYTSAAQVATAAHCKAQKPAGPETSLFASDEVTCNGPGFELVDWFKDDASLANYKRASVGAGTVTLYGNNWAISCVDNKADCAAFQKIMGGSLE